MMMMKVKEDLNCVLPHDLMVDILLRQPVKSLMRFKAVSPTWRSFISNPHFAKAHFHLAAAPTHRLLLNRINHDSDVESLDLQPSLGNPSAVVTLKFPAPYFRTLGSCRGILLLAKKLAPSLDDLIVWNPSTGCHRKVPLSYDHWDSWYDPLLTPNISHFDLLSSSLYCFRDGPSTHTIPPYYLLDSDLHGFGYDPSKDDYLFVLIRLGEFHPSQVTNRIGVLSLKTNVPSFYGDQVEYMAIGGPWTLTGLYLNQTLHWVVTSEEIDCVIIAFDLLERSLTEIPFSYELNEKLVSYAGYHLGVLGGCLSLCYSAEGVNFPEEGHYDYEMTEIWVMKEYKVQDSWTKTFVISVNAPKRFLPIWSIEGGGVLGADDTGGLQKYNDEGELLESHAYGIDDKFSLKYFDMYKESLLTLPGGDFEEGNEDA
ncbi:F-box/kelch-repeat protein At3g23880-like [Lotus japonicus]|uniref:F-box/kelch-repeat protein At3g23880-like n=1 Tax=Lotus japonicus TaxID=34305 RepID=UPI002588E1C3|nr:F-box/kelch-repeat protein At3g23880-like [Lotus japonicus]